MFKTLEYSSFTGGLCFRSRGGGENQSSAHFYLVYKIKDQILIEYKSL